MGGRLENIALSLPVLIVVGLFGLYLVFGFFRVDPLAKKLLPWVGGHKLSSRLSAEQVTFNPLTLEATVTGLKLAEKNGAPLTSLERCYINIRIVNGNIDHTDANRPGKPPSAEAVLVAVS